MNYRQKIRKAIECHQFGNEGYGEWGALRYDQRVLIKRLLDELDSADDYILKMQKEKQELKKQIEDMTLCRDIASGHREEVQDRETILLNQQKEFIEWLESNLEALEMCDRELILTNNKKEIKAYKEVLSKYKEIIGGSNDKTNKKLGRIKQSSSKR